MLGFNSATDEHGLEKFKWNSFTCLDRAATIHFLRIQYIS